MVHDFPILTLIMLVPVIGAIVVLLIPRERDDAIKAVSAGSLFISMLLSSGVFMAYDRARGGFQFMEKRSGFRSSASAITSASMASPRRSCC